MIGNLMHCTDETRLETVYEFTLHDWEVLDGYCQIQLWSRRRASCPKMTVDWGDGTIQEIETLAQYPLWHNYRETGTFRVTFDEGLAWFRLVDCFAVDSKSRAYVVRPDVHPIQWGDFVESASATYSYWNGDVHGNTGVWGVPPPWGKSIGDVSFCYSCSRHIEGRIPRWTNRITKAGCCFQLTGITGRIPRWPRNMADCQQCYESCLGLVGDIPPWPPSIELANGTYLGCKGLVGAWSDDPAELMPDNGCGHSDCVTDASDSLRALFDEDWGGTRGKERAGGE